MITHIDLEHLIFDWKFVLLETLLPLKINLLSLWISVKGLDVFFFLHLTNGCHVGKELLEYYPHTISESQPDV